YPTFKWSKKIQDTVIASFFWGYMTLQIPAGQLAHRFGSRRLLCGSMLINCVVSIFLPLAAYYGGWICTVIFRMMQGLSQACIFPGMHTFFGKWAPLEERGRLTALTYGGQALGTVLGLPITGFISATSLGWPGIFRFYGILSGIIGVVLWFFAADTPAKHPMISHVERKYIEDGLGIKNGYEMKQMQVPWSQILRSRGLYAIIVAHIGQTWGQLILYSEVPAFMDKIMGVNIKAVRCVPAALGLVILAFVPKNIYVVESILVVICAFKISAHMGFQVNHIDISPNFAGTMMSLSNFVSNLVSSLAPILAGFILTDVNDEYLWRQVFFIAAGFYFFSNLFYVIFGTAEKAEWNEPCFNNGHAEGKADEEAKSCLGIRHLQTAMLFLAMLLAYGMRVNISMAVVAMTDKDNDNSFDWSMQTQSVILSSFFWGYIILQIPAGELAAKFGGSVLITISLGVNSAVSLMIPLAAHYVGIIIIKINSCIVVTSLNNGLFYTSHQISKAKFVKLTSFITLANSYITVACCFFKGGWQAVCACRVLQGLSQGFTYPSIHNLIGKWLLLISGQLGTALQLMASGFIAQYWGWPAIFYVNGCLGAIWTVLYVFLGSDSPQSSRMISEEEKLYIQTSLGHVGEQKKLKTPWKTIFTSLPFLSLILVHSCQAWGFWTLMTEMPSYLKQVLGVDIKSNGMMSALPYLAMFLLSFPFGFISDWLLLKGYLSITTARKLSNSIGMCSSAKLKLKNHATAPVGTESLVHIDMAPNFAGTLMGITNCVANMVAIIVPLAAGTILKDETDAGEWRKVFYLSSAIFIAGNVFFLIFGTSERQKWNDDGTEHGNDTASENKVDKVV
ncbi:Sodium-dependent phosphate transporter, partial [Operophtera brumata]